MKNRNAPPRVWRDLSVRAKGFIAVALPLIAFVATMLLVYLAKQHQSEASGWLRHTLQVRTEVRDVREAIFESEAATRGYALTGDTAWLAKNQRAQMTLGEALQRIGSSVKDSPEQTAKLQDLEAAIVAHRSALDMTRAGYEAHPNSEAALRLLGNEKRAMEKVSSELRGLLDLEDALIIPLRKTYLRAEWILSLSFAVSLGIGCLATILGMTLFTKSIGNRIKELGGHAQRVGEGLPFSVTTEAHDELGRLAQALAQSSAVIVQQNQSLREAKEEADSANQAKSDFLSRMSHELRTPLNSVLGFAQVLEMGELTGRSQDCVEHILKGGRHLLGLIDEILDISRIEAGTLPLSPEPVLLADAIAQAMDMVRPMAGKAGVKVFSESALQSYQHVLADRQRLKQVLLNLLSNAVKYNQRNGSVSIDWEKRADRVVIQVADTGIGLSAEDQGRLFVPFERLGAERTDVQGTGLGLALSKRLVEAMQGTIGVRSEAGKGTTFWMDFAAAECPTITLQRQSTAPAQPSEKLDRTQTVLYVEDNISNLKLMEHVLEHRPHVKLMAAMQGRLGLDLALEHQPDLIFLDLHLPDLNGDMVLRQLRADPRTRDIPTVIISADATAGQVQRLLESGANEYLTKPFDVSRLLKILDDNLRGPEEPRPEHKVDTKTSA